MACLDTKFGMKRLAQAMCNPIRQNIKDYTTIVREK